MEVYHEVRKETNLYGGRLRAPPALDGQDGRLSAVADLQLFKDPVQVQSGDEIAARVAKGTFGAVVKK